MTELTRSAQTQPSGIVAPIAELVELRNATRHLGLAPRRHARAALAGPYRSQYRGRGIEFDEVRAYQPGDDVRHIDWRVTARTGSVYSKVFHEERERPTWLLLDTGPSMRFGTRHAFKSVAAARAAALLAWSAEQQGDRAGGLVLSSTDCSVHPPRSGETALLSLLATMSRATSSSLEGNGPSLDTALARLYPRVRAGSRVFVLSDFYGFDAKFEAHLAALARRADVSCVLVYDPLEESAPPPGKYRASNGDGICSFSSQSARWREEYEAEFAGRRDSLRATCRKFGVDLLPLRTDADPVEALAVYLDPRLDLCRSRHFPRRST